MSSLSSFLPASSSAGRSAAASAPLSRRGLFAAGTVGLASLTSLAVAAPASAQGETWTEAFMTREETREGFEIGAMDQWQVENAQFIIAVCKGHGLEEAVTTVTLITAIVESWLYNYEPAVDLDSGGLFQQRPSMGWGSAADVRHKKKAIDAFLGLGEISSAPGLLQAVPDVASWEPGQAAQTVQASAHPERYAEQVTSARTIMDRYSRKVAPFTA
ncbi:hypothetical protein ACFQS2_04415 [Brachybacterium sp. GCM10030267]|uniref:hypothetical protein n=1 Tax=Brachybacterium sp. GCM10030267 TaxID=3273381 RepID=UPI00360B663E